MLTNMIIEQHKRAKMTFGFYSPSWRFKTPEGAIADPAIKDADAQKAKDAELSKERQRADQEAANARKAREQAQAAQGQLSDAQSQINAMKEQLSKLEAKAADKGIPDLKEEDYTDSDVTLVKAIKALDEKINAKDKVIQNLEKKVTDAEQEKLTAQQQRQRDAAYNEILSDLDSEYGVENRNKAIESFNKLVEEGKTPVNNPAKAVRVLEKCYKDAKKAREEAIKKGDIVLDSGSGGGTPKLAGTGKLKPGSLNEVLDQLKSKT